MILGGFVAERRRRSQARRGTLAGFSDKSIALRAKYRKRIHRASLRRNGLIRVKRKFYKSPSAAGAAVVGRPVNGWTFWRFRGRDGKWHPLKSIRK